MKYFLSRFYDEGKTSISNHDSFEDAILALQGEFADHKVCNHLDLQLGLDVNGDIGISCASWRRPTRVVYRWIKTTRKDGCLVDYRADKPGRGWRRQDVNEFIPNEELKSLIPKSPDLYSMLIMSEGHFKGAIMDGEFEGNDLSVEREALALAYS